MKDVLKREDIISFTGRILEKEKMKEALCNDVYFIKAEKGKFILKIATNDIRKKELLKEYNIITEKNLEIKVPKIYLYRECNTFSFFLMEYIEGIKITKFNEFIISKISKSLKSIHSVQMEEKYVDFDKLLSLAESNMINNRIDLDEFNINGKFIEPKTILDYLKRNVYKVECSFLHGDYRPKNMIILNSDLYILDWGLSFYGDIYYDFAIIKYYLTEEEFNIFLSSYGIADLDDKRLKYNELLSKFLNV